MTKFLPYSDDFVLTVLTQPRSYTASGSFEEIIAFLHGYFSARDSLLSPNSKWRNFIHWLSSKYWGHSKPDLESSGVWNRFKEHWGWENACEQLCLHYKEYLQLICTYEAELIDKALEEDIYREKI
jgi:hypothetical protein